MLRKAAPYLIVVSVAINIAFVAVWVAHAWPSRSEDQPDERPAIWCPLHRELQVSPTQWAEIEPRLREFQAALVELCQQVDRTRPEVIEMIAAEEPDREAIRAKQDEILATKRAIQGRVVDHLLAEKQILTADQQARLFEILGRRIGCTPNPPMSGRGLGRGMGQVLRQQADRSAKER